MNDPDQPAGAMSGRTDTVPPVAEVPLVSGVGADQRRQVEPLAAAEHQPTGLEAVALRYQAALPAGRFFHFPITALDHTGVPAWSNVFLPGPLGGGDGYGLTDAEAEVGALGELHERLQSLWVVPTLPRERATYKDLAATYGERQVVDPVTLGLPAGSSYTRDLPRLWVTMKRYPDGHAWVPLEAAASSPAELPDGYVPLFLPVSNGLGAGLDVTRALCHSVLELLQRDGNSVSYRALDRGRVVDVSAGLPEEVLSILQRLQDAGLSVNIKLAATDFGLVNLYVNGYGPEGDAPQIKLTAGGEACDLDRTAALRKALLEFAFSRTRLAFSHGPLRAAAKVAPAGYLDAHRVHFREGGEETRALKAMLRWLDLPPGGLKAELAPIYAERERIPWEGLPSRPELAGATPGVRLETVAERLAGFDILYQELATPRARAHGVVVVKAVVPGLEVETASYGRVGERNLRRLLAWESPLVGLGAAPPGAGHVHLSEAAAADLGGSAWLDLAGLEAQVGNLYPLYREPSRHAASYVLEGKMG